MALQNIAGGWSENVNQLAMLQAPQNLLGRHIDILRGDINEQWARWFVEGLADPRRFAKEKTTYPFLFEEVLKSIELKFHTEKTRSEKDEIAVLTANIIHDASNLISAERRRRKLTEDERRVLLDISGTDPRCWICGFAFSEQVVESFLSCQKIKVELPPFVDILKPRGLVERDLEIEVDHVVPFSKGGDKDLKLACGWCNRHKSANMSIYDVAGQPRIAGANTLGIISLPQPFWIVRLLALGRKCEHPDGCNKSVENAEMTIVAIRDGGALNPINLRITCYEHDPMGNKRLQPLKIVDKLWSQNKSVC